MKDLQMLVRVWKVKYPALRLRRHEFEIDWMIVHV